jgi:hypothetical protein
VLFCLNHAFSLFYSGYFGDRVSHFAQFWSSIFLFYTSCCCWDDRCIPPHSAFFHWDGVSQTFLSRLAWKCVPPDVSLPCSLGWQTCTTTPRPPTVILLISASQVARIASISHQRLTPCS